MRQKRADELGGLKNECRCKKYRAGERLRGGLGRKERVRDQTGKEPVDRRKKKIKNKMENRENRKKSEIQCRSRVKTEPRAEGAVETGEGAVVW